MLLHRSPLSVFGALVRGANLRRRCVFRCGTMPRSWLGPPPEHAEAVAATAVPFFAGSLRLGLMSLRGVAWNGKDPCRVVTDAAAELE